MKLKIPFHFYECTDCVIGFGVEAHEDIDHSIVVCPICKREDTIDGVSDNVVVELEKEYVDEGEEE